MSVRRRECRNNGRPYYEREAIVVTRMHKTLDFIWSWAGKAAKSLEILPLSAVVVVVVVVVVGN